MQTRPALEEEGGKLKRQRATTPRHDSRRHSLGGTRRERTACRCVSWTA